MSQGPHRHYLPSIPPPSVPVGPDFFQDPEAMPFFFMSLLFLWALWERWQRFQHKEQAEAELYEAHAQNLRLCRRLLAERKGDTPEIRKQVFEFCRYNPPESIYAYALGSEEDQRLDEPPFEEPVQ